MVTLEISKETLTREYIASSDSVELFNKGYSGETTMYPPCKVATTQHIQLFGTRSVGSTWLNHDDTVLVKNQINEYENGVYRVQYQDNWLRVSSPVGSLWNIMDGTYKGTLFVVTYDEYSGGPTEFSQFL